MESLCTVHIEIIYCVCSTQLATITIQFASLIDVSALNSTHIWDFGWWGWVYLWIIIINNNACVALWHYKLFMQCIIMCSKIHIHTSSVRSLSKQGDSSTHQLWSNAISQQQFSATHDISMVKSCLEEHRCFTIQVCESFWPMLDVYHTFRLQRVDNLFGVYSLIDFHGNINWNLSRNRWSFNPCSHCHCHCTTNYHIDFKLTIYGYINSVDECIYIRD